VPDDNPRQDHGELARTYWSIGHRNLLGIDVDSKGRLWTHEMGPRHGDELKLVVKGQNYGWPIGSNGDNCSGIPIPDHESKPEFKAPKAVWVPAISPAGFTIYDSDMFPDWQGDGFIGGLSSQALIRGEGEGENASEADLFEWVERIREVEQGPDGGYGSGGQGGRKAPDADAAELSCWPAFFARAMAGNAASTSRRPGQHSVRSDD